MILLLQIMFKIYKLTYAYVYDCYVVMATMLL